MPKFVPRQRKHKVLARQIQETKPHPPDTNTNQELLLPLSEADREAKRQELRNALRSQQGSVSSKKQKRLDKYIENKLRRDETADYVRRLEHERQKFDVNETAGLLSSKDLNKPTKGKKRDWHDFVEGQLNTDNKPAFSQSAKHAPNKIEVESEDDIVSEDSFEADHQDAFNESKTSEPVNDQQWLAKKAPAPQGSGLAKPLEIGADGLPLIPTRGRSRLRKDTAVLADESVETDKPNGATTDNVEVPWEGFDSEEDQPMASEREEDNGDNGNSLASEDFFEDDGSDSEVDFSDSGSAETDTSSSEPDKIRPRTSAFKTWANQQLNQSIGHTPSYLADGSGVLRPPPVKQKPVVKENSKPVELVNGLPAVVEHQNHRFVHNVKFDRPDAIQESRLQLPILQREQEIMEAIHNNPVVVIKGETGSGKTTQLPQFLYEAGYGDPAGPTPGLIGVTQPRRVAAVSMAKRVSEELGAHGSRVAHQIRFDSTVSARTAIKFMTDGILLRELSQDLLLKKYSAIIVDEAHERSVNTDILIGILSKVVPARMRKDKFNPDPKPLKLIIMSATLNIDDFLHEKLFAASLRPPIVEAEGRQHRVTVHFARRSRADYIEEVVEKVKRAHHKLPKGGMLVFLTGQNEIRQVQSELINALAQSSGKIHHHKKPPRMHIAASEIPLEIDDLDFGNPDTDNLEDADRDLEVNILTQSDEEHDEREFEISDDESENGGPEESIPDSKQQHLNNKDPYDHVKILPLYSQLPTKEQLKVFEPPPERSRLIVLATNVAETSLTIPGIRYVFDCGRSKERKYDLNTGVQKFEIDYISKASAEQRAGRAGRTGPGHCWRLYSSAIYERFFPEHAQPEILRAPAENVVLQIKSFAYPRPVVDFPFPTPPTLQSLKKAETLLSNLGALNTSGFVSDIGKEISIFPLSPRLGKILSTAIHAKCMLAQAIASVAGLAVSEIFVNEVAAGIQAGEDDNHDDNLDSKKQAYGRARATLSRHDKFSDAMKLLTAVSMYVNTADKEAFCEQYYLRPKAMTEVLQLLQQLKSIVQANHPSIQMPVIGEPNKWTTAQLRDFNHTVGSGYIDQIAVRWDCAPTPPTLPNKPRRALDVPYLPLIPLSHSSSELHDRAVFIHPSSVLSRVSVKDCPQYIVYSHLQQSQARTIATDQVTKTRMFPLTGIDAASIGLLARDTALLQFGKPVPKTKVEDLPGLPKRRICWVSTELRGGGAGSYGWPLPPTKVRQVLDVKQTSGWRIEEILT